MNISLEDQSELQRCYKNELLLQQCDNRNAMAEGDIRERDLQIELLKNKSSGSSRFTGMDIAFYYILFTILYL